MAGYGKKKKHIDGPMIDQARKEVTGRSAWAGPLQFLRAIRRGLVPASLVGMLLVLLVIGFREYLGDGRKGEGDGPSREGVALSEETEPPLFPEADTDPTPKASDAAPPSGSSSPAPVPVTIPPDDGRALARASSSVDATVSAPAPSVPEEAAVQEVEVAESAAEIRPGDMPPPPGPGEAASFQDTPLLETAKGESAAAATQERILRSLYGKTLLETREEAFLAVVQRWGSGVSGEEEKKLYRSAPDLYKAARALGFECLRFRGNINRVRALNLPALLELRLGETMTKRYMALLAFEGNKGRISPPLPDGSSLVPWAVLEPLWYGTAYVLWRDVWGGRRYLAKGMKGGTVGQLQSSLKDLGYYKQKPNNVFDEKTMEAVSNFQKDHFLDEDGILGPQTRIVLYQALKKLEMPTL